MNNFSWRGFFVDPSIQRLVRSKAVRRRSKIYVYARRSTITQGFVGRLVYIYNGRQFFNVYVRQWMVGHKFGEFAVTKRLGSAIHNSKRNQKRRAKLKRK
jgi:small subunit ribosomal protein S19